MKKLGLKITKWDTRSLIGVNIGFRKMYSTQVGLVLNLLTGLISPKYHFIFDEIFSTVVSSTSIDTEVQKRLATSRKSRIQVMLYQEDDPELDDEWLTANERLTCFSKAREKIVGRVRGEESPFIK